MDFTSVRSSRMRRAILMTRSAREAEILKRAAAPDQEDPEHEEAQGELHRESSHPRTGCSGGPSVIVISMTFTMARRSEGG
eukprot:13408797-Heterocapsa_arctica.AAC.1